jgi:histone H3/H4
MPSKKETAAPTTVATDGENKKKSRGAPKPHPPKSVIQRIARKKANGKNFQAAAYKLAQQLVVAYAQNIFFQNEQVLANRKGKTLTVKDLRVLSNIAQTASSVPEKTDLSATVKAFEDSIKSNPAYLKKKADRAKKREEKKAQKAAEATAAGAAQTTTTSS